MHVSARYLHPTTCSVAGLEGMIMPFLVVPTAVNTVEYVLREARTQTWTLVWERITQHM